MFAKMIKNLFNKSEEFIENIKESTDNITNPTESQIPSDRVNENEFGVSPFNNPIEYSNHLVEINAPYEEYYVAFYQGIYANDRNKISKALENWRNAIDKILVQTKKTGTFNGDDSLLIEYIDNLNKKRNLIDSHFVKYAEAVLSNADNVEELYNEAEQLKDELFDEINTAIDDFGIKHQNIESDIAYLQEMQKQDALVEADAKDNPLLEPIHGISLYDYAAGMIKIGSGVPSEKVLSTLGVEKPQWDEADLIWQQRMQEDPNMTVASKYGQYFAKVDEHPTLGNLSATSTSDSNNSNVEKMKTDEHFFYDLMAERQAAYEVGKDGGQYIQDKYGINLMDFQSQALVWTRSGNYHQMLTYQEKQYEKYLKEFQKDMGGTIADDIEF